MKEILVGIQPGPGLRTVGPVRRLKKHVEVYREARLNGQEAVYAISMDEWRRYNSYKIAKSHHNYVMSGKFIPK